MANQPLSSSVQPTDIYGGDEVSALVLDPGYVNTRAGFAGEDIPRSVFSSFYGQLRNGEGESATTKDLFGENLLFPAENLEVKNYMSRESVVEDWDAATKLWENMLVKQLQPLSQTAPSKNGLNDLGPGEKQEADGEGDVTMDDALENVEAQEKPLAENPLLITEAPWNSGKNREKAIEIAMESWGCPAFWLSRTPVCAAFAAGKASALVIDVGGANTSVTAIHDGLILKRSTQKSHVGSLWLSEQLRSLFNSSDPKVEITPRYRVLSKTPVDAGQPAQAKLKTFPFEVSDSFRINQEEQVLTEFKESVVEVWRGPGKFSNPGNEELAKSQVGRVFEMPDGANQMWREQRFRVTEGMWDETAALPVAEEYRVSKSQTIPELIKSALNNVDVDLRPNLLGNIVVTGSTSLIPGFNDRLNAELTNLYPGVKIKIHAAGLTTERRFGAWIGGSILASLGTFHQMWISRKEYEENGVGIVEKRCK